MDAIISGVRRFHKKVLPQYRELLRGLAEAQHPVALWTGCSDSRVDPQLITQSKPGTLFVARNPGNIVPPHERPSGMGAAIEYAVEVLGVQHVIVCGHSGCGAMQAVLDPPSVASLPHVRQLIGHAWQPHAARATPSLGEAIERNVVLQLRRVSAFPQVARRLAAGQISLHGWTYDVGTGELKARDGETFFDLLQVYAPVSPENARASGTSGRGYR